MAADYRDTVNLNREDVNFGDLNAPPEKKNNKTLWIILAVVAAILLCCCLVVVLGGAWLWNNGDRLLDEWGSAVRLASYFFA
jgi:hypothetical protein